MNSRNELVETVLREVILRLQRGEQDTKNAPTSKHPLPHFNQKVITADCLKHNLIGNTQILIGSNSIITPSARDVLRERNIDWSRATAKTSVNSGGARWSVAVIDSTAAVEAAMTDLEKRTEVCWQRQSGGDVRSTVTRLLSDCELDNTDGTVVITREPELAACLANRHRRVRAAVVRDVQHVKNIRQQIAANLFCLDANRLTFIEIRNLLTAISNGPVPKIPDEWSD